MVSTFRIFGGELGESKAIIDADVVGVTMGGDIELSDQNSTKVWSIEPKRLRKLGRDSLTYDKSTLDTTKEVWNAIDAIEQSYSTSTASDKSHYIESAKTLFRNAK